MLRGFKRLQRKVADDYCCMAPFKPHQEIHFYENKGFSSFLTSALYDLYKENTCCDITVTVGQKTFSAHKVVLCAVSPYFKTMFTSGFKESSSSEVTIEGNSDTFGYLLRFAYTGNLRLSQATVVDVLCLAMYMQIDRAVQLCENYIGDICREKSMSFATAWAVIPHAERHDLHKLTAILMDYVDTYTKENFLEFSQSNLFLESEMDDIVLKCLKNCDILVTLKSEEQVLKTMIYWMKHNWDERKKHAVSLLKLVPLGLVPLEYLKKLHDGGDIPECTAMLAEAIQDVEANEGVNPRMLVKQYPTVFAWDLISAFILIRHRNAFYYNTPKHRWSSFKLASPTIKDRPNEYINRYTLAVINGELYAVGGRFRQHGTFVLSRYFSKYNPGTNEWESLDRMNHGRIDCAVVELDGHIYALGGCGIQSVERYNISEGKWSTPGEIAPMAKFVNVISAVAFKGCILIWGLRLDIQRPSKALQVYVPSTDSWHVQNIPLQQLADETTDFTSGSIPPVLTVHKGKCYMIDYVNVSSSDSDDWHGVFQRKRKKSASRPQVKQVDLICVAGKPLVSIGEAQPQDLIPDNHCGAFVIDKEVFVVVNGYVHNTGINTVDGEENLIDLDEWDSVMQGNIKLKARDNVVHYTFDRVHLPKK